MAALKLVPPAPCHRRTLVRLCRPVWVLPLLVDCAAAVARSAQAQPTGGNASEIIANLRGRVVESTVQKEKVLQANTNQSIAAFKANLDALFKRAEDQNAAELLDITREAEANLQQAREEFAQARADAAARGRAVAAHEVLSAGRAAEDEAKALESQANELLAEANSSGVEVSKVAADIDKSAMQARAQQKSWPRVEVAQAIRLADNATARAPELRDLAASAERLDILVNKVSAEVLGTVKKAVDHVNAARDLTRQALEQATQNAAKITLTQELVAEATHAASLAASQSVAAALRGVRLAPELLHTLGVTHVVVNADSWDVMDSTSGGGAAMFQALHERPEDVPGLRYLKCDIPDRDDDRDLERVLEGAARFVAAAEAEGGVCLVRLHGQSRSASVACAFLVLTRSFSVEGACRAVEAGLPDLDPRLLWTPALERLAAAVRRRSLEDAQAATAAA